MNKKSIEYVLERMHITESKQSGEWITVSCPLAPWTHSGGKDHNPSFGIRESNGVSGVNCFSCGYKGGMLSLVRTYGRHAIEEGLWSEEDLKQITDYVILAEAEDEVAAPAHHSEEPVVSTEVWKHLDQMHPYLEERGITPETVQKWHLGYAHDYRDATSRSTLHERVLFPLFDKVGKKLELRGVVGRTVIDEDPKYKNIPRDFQKSNYLYGAWLVENQRIFVVVEGPVDCLILNQNLEKSGMTDMLALALLGSRASDEQVEWLKDHAEEVITMLDNDPSGKLGVKALIDDLDAHLLVSMVSWPEGMKDPGEIGEGALAMIRERKTVLEHRLEKLLQNGSK